MKKRFGAFLTAVFLLVTTVVSAGGLFLVPAMAENGAVLKVHYHREDGSYDGWDAWLWEDGKDGAAYSFEDEDGEKVATMETTPGTTSVGYIIRKTDWSAKDVDADQFIDISDVVSGTVDIYIESGKEGYTRKDEDDVVTGVKVKAVSYDGSGTVSVTMTGKPADVAETAFSISGKDGEVGIDKVKAGDDNTYTLTLSEPLDNLGSYTLSFDGSEYSITMPDYYSTDEFEKEYTYTGDDLGYTYAKDSTSFRVWAPTADSVRLVRYESGTASEDDMIEAVDMTADVNGTWVCEVQGDLNGTYYVYEASIDGNTVTAMDPYARSSGVNGERSMVLDLDSTDPDGWDKDSDPNSTNAINDDVIYETHIRDFTVGDDNGIKNQGKFLGVCESGTKTSDGIPTGLDHAKELGVTHLHILPMYDFGSVDETADDGSYNWGYDPVNYNVPEGSYSTDPYDGKVRVSEMKQMVSGIHKEGLSVVMDVVYNHVYNAEDFCVNKLVPGYFSRISSDGTYSNGSGCGNDTATERSMVRKYIVDSVNYWADEYHIDGFRFDLVGLIDTDTINEIVKTVHEKHPNVIFYGEGWEMSTTVTKDNVTLSTQKNSQETPGFAYFNDTIRDGLKGSVFDSGKGFVSGGLGYELKVKSSFKGDEGWCKSPSQAINYVSCHDNNTLYDRIRLSRPDASDEDIVKMNNLAASVYILAEGTPFMQAGEEMLRTKTNSDGTYNSNSYNAGDEVNRIDWSSLGDKKYSSVFEYYKGLIAFRKAHSVLRLTTADDVSSHVEELDGLESQVVGFDIKGGNEGESAEEMYVIYNASTDTQKITLPDGNWNAYIDGEKAGTKALYSVKDTASVSPVSALVLVKEDASESPASDNETVSHEESSSSVDVVIALICVAVALVCVILVIKKEKKSKNR